MDTQFIVSYRWLLVIVFSFATHSTLLANTSDVELTWGEHAPSSRKFAVKLSAIGDASVSNVHGIHLEPGEGERDGVWHTTAGNGDTDGITFTLTYPVRPVSIIEQLHIIWADLIEQSDTDTARRLTEDASFRKDGRKLTVVINAEGEGFSVTLDQLLRNGSMWIPSLNTFLTIKNQSLDDYEKTRAAYHGLGVIDQLHAQPDASYREYQDIWQNMGSPAYLRAQQPVPGHIICLSWDSATHKFGIDRGGGVWNDYGNPDHFRLWFGFASLADGILDTWRGQQLLDGLPLVTTNLEKDGLRYSVEQFAYPLNGPPRQRNGDGPMVLMQKIVVTNPTGNARSLNLTINHQRMLNNQQDDVSLEKKDGQFLLEDAASKNVLLSVRGGDGTPAWSGIKDYQEKMRRANMTVSLNVPANGIREIVVKLPSPVVALPDVSTLTALEYSQARATTIDFWQKWLDQGAQFEVPEAAVNELYRANLWHALRLPRRHGGDDARQIDLPYSNFAYSQTGTPWPINQAVYVDSFIYDLRGYFDVSEEELAAIFRNNLQPDGRVSGNANWFAYTPAMLLATAAHYELSGDRAAFDRLLPQAMRCLDWCLSQLKQAERTTGITRGLVNGPLNDITGAGTWAFNQAYLFAGLNEFGRVLQQIGNSRSAECLNYASKLHADINRAFQAASTQSPLVELRDHTWSPYVPTEASIFGRLFTQWYPTDVDTGAVHLIRLRALDAKTNMATALLNDHEDNLFLLQRGLANEPVYNQQATAYLLRDDPKAAIRVFYSLMAGGFSQSVFEPVEHRWTHGQYFGPPSTDGAWAELYRNMLVREVDDDGLFLLQATPRAWLEDGKNIVLRNAPTYFGTLSMRVNSQLSQGRIHADITMPNRRRPHFLRIRLRNPRSQRIRSVTLNGQVWKDFNPENEWITIQSPSEGAYALDVHY